MAVDCAGNVSLPLRFDAPAFLTPAVYGDASSTAHAVLGVALAAIVCIWGVLVVSREERVSRSACYAAAGAASVAAGAYLLLWVFALSAPRGADAAAVRAFAGRDLVQQQHAAMSCLFVAAGLSELAHARALRHYSASARLRRPWVHSLWFGAIACVALIFVGHPQRAARAVAAHVAVGVSLLAGGFLLACEKRARFAAESLDAPLAGLAVAVAAVVLVAYVEPAEAGAVHRGVETRCMPGWPLAVLGYCYAAAALAALAAAGLADAWQRRERRATYELAPRDDDWPLPEA